MAQNSQVIEFMSEAHDAIENGLAVVLEEGF
jgi:hypothetical protein